MKIREIAKLLDAEILCGNSYSESETEYAFSSDLMSDVLTLKNDSILLITGLANVQTIRTAEMSDIKCIIFARGKKANNEMIELATENEMVLIECRYSMFKTSGLLYEAGVQPVY
jgi:predicted transcriptional regulator